MKVVISSGHGKHVRGASGYIDEVDEARLVVEQVALQLRASGVGVTTFHDDVSQSQGENLDRIVDFHNSKTRDLDISVHFNAYNTTTKPMGSEVLYVSSTGHDWANLVVDAICGVSGLVNRGPKERTDLAFLNGTDEPAILIETCFVDSKADVDIYHAKFLEICNAIAGAIAGEEAVPPPATSDDALTIDQVVAIMTMAQNSAIADYDWKDRGQAPIGMTEGLAVMFAQMLKRLDTDTESVAMAMSEPIGSHEKDALSYYGIQATGRENVLRKLFTFMYGLAMRESKGNYTEGRDTTVPISDMDDPSIETEAGMFQQSWNSSGADDEMEWLLEAYRDGGRGPGYVQVFKRGITLKDTDSLGSGDGYDYQELAKSNPAFAVEMCGVGLRCLYNHWGPIKRYEVEMRPEAEELLDQVEAFIRHGAEPAPPSTDVAAAKEICMEEISAAIDDLLIRVGAVKVV